MSCTGAVSRGWTKFVLLMWKNWLLQIRAPTQTIFEILVPVVFSLLLVLVRSLATPEAHDEVTSYTPFSLVLPRTNEMNCTSLQPFNITSIAWSPYHEKLATVMEEAAERLEVEAVGFTNSYDLIYNLTSAVLVQNYLAAVIFDDSLADDPTSDLPQSLTMTIRFPSELRPNANPQVNWKTNLLFPEYQTPGPRDKEAIMGGMPYYYCQGFLSVQESVSLALVKNSFNISWDDLPEIYLQRYPYVPYIDDPLLDVMSQFVSIIIMASFVYSCTNMAKAVTTEKETQLKEALKIVGLPGWLHWTAWFIKNFTFLLITSALMVVLIKVPWYPGNDLSVFTYSNWIILFIFMVFYAVASISFSFMVSVFFSKATTAATVAGLLWFLSYVPYFFMSEQYSTISLATKLATCLCHNTAMSYGFQLFIMFEGTGAGLQWTDFWKPVNQNDDLVLGHVILMLIADTVIYMLITLYVEAIFPGEYGVPLPWYFFLQKSYWCGNDYIDMNDQNNTSATDGEFFEKEPSHLTQGVQIKNLRKVFRKNKVAVNNLNLNLFEGQITVLLGHNGAGKTTTMSMLTGMLPQTTGTAIINGYDIRKDLKSVRDSLGFCPQHNILFDKLTVTEHLYFFGKLKGFQKYELEKMIKKYLKLLGIEDKANSQSRTLSGGMKRKLSVGIALCGQSKVVFFDEPTAGMDPSARRSLWDLLSEEKKTRTVLLTTHYMDEADILGDRIAIMADGKLCCCGSSFFLKKKFGAGYHLIIEKGMNCDSNRVLTLLRKYINNLDVGQDIGSELSYVLNDDMSSVFEKMLRELEENQKTLGILSYGISLTTMEEVFMRVGKDEEEHELNENVEKYTTDSKETLHIYQDEEKQSFISSGQYHLKMNQFKAMIMKRALYTLRTWILFIIMTIIPALFLVISIIIIRTMDATDELPPLNLKLEGYGLNYVLAGTLSNATDSARNLYDLYKSLLPQEWLVDLGTTDANVSAAFLDMQAENIRTANENYIVSAEFGSNNTKDILIGWFNGQPFHSAPVSLNLLINTLMRFYSQDNSWSMEIVNHPFPYSQNSQITLATDGRGAGFQIAFNMAFSMSYLAPFFILFYIKERIGKFKLLQFVSGVEVIVFWCSSFIWDVILFMGPLLAFIITMAAMQQEGYSTFNEIGRITLLMILFAWSSLPLIYLASFLFTVPTDGYNRMTIFFIFTGAAGFMIVQVLDSLNSTTAAEVLNWILLIVPHYTLSHAISNMNVNEQYQEICGLLKEICSFYPNPCCKDSGLCGSNGCIDWTENLYDLRSPGIGRNLIFFAVTGVTFFVILFCIELGYVKKVIDNVRSFRHSKTVPGLNLGRNIEDDDVLNEKKIVNQICSSSQMMEYSLVMRNLTKLYGSFLAVDRLSVAVSSKECFGLLGINGAGKSTTFKMLTGDEKISSGDAYVNGLSIKSNMKEVYQQIGYCPQFDALIEELTGYETLMMFCLIRGIQTQDAKINIHKWGEKLLLSQHLHKKIKEYSGGNKRKLSTAIAMVGEPAVVFLDEPTAGMDPVARRHVWNVICSVRDQGKCIILTSHSMEECEALCTRLAIMVNGAFQCLGSTQHLKNKFTEGFTLSIKLKKIGGITTVENNRLETVKEFISSTFPGALKREEHDLFLTYYIPNPSLPWSRMFGIMERAKQNLDIEDYSVGQATLEQVFLSFAKQQIQTSDLQR